MSNRDRSYSGPILTLQINVNELLWIVLTSVILTLFFDTPFGNIKKLLFKSPKPRVNPAISNFETKPVAVDGASDVATKEL